MLLICTASQHGGVLKTMVVHVCNTEFLGLLVGSNFPKLEFTHPPSLPLDGGVQHVRRHFIGLEPSAAFQARRVRYLSITSLSRFIR